MGNQVKDFEEHFSAQARGMIPYSQGFTIVGKVRGSKEQFRANTEQTKNGIVSISPAMAAVEAAAELVGGGKKRSRRRKTTQRLTRTKKRGYRNKKSKLRRKKKSRTSTKRREAL